MYIKPSPVSLISSRSFSSNMAKIIRNNQNKDAKSIIKTLCESYANMTDDIIKYYVKKSICKIIDANACIDQLLYYMEYEFLNCSLCNK